MLRASGFLDPLDRSAEVLFGVIMVLALTGAISVVEPGEARVREVLVGAIACNFVWGVVDAAFYLMSTFAERARGVATYWAIKRTGDLQAAQALVAELIPAGLARILGPAELQMLHRRIAISGAPSAGLQFNDYMAAGGVFLVVFLSTFPIIVPFLVFTDVETALRASQVVGIVMLFLAGWSLGRNAGRSVWRTSLAMVVVGVTLSAFTFALGG